ncbi:MAG: hypothetical protein QM655_05500 [Nocardioidaceae bacterium]
MMLAGEIRIGFRFARTGGYVGGARAAGIAIVSAIGVLASLICLSAFQIMDHQEAVKAARSVNEPDRRSEATSFTGSFANTWFHDHLVRVVVAAKNPSMAAVPQGIPKLPTAGEVYVSPAVLRVSEENPAVRAFLGSSRIIGTIAKTGLLSPDELRVIQGVGTDPTTRQGLTPVQSYGRSSGGRSRWAGPLAFFLPLALALVYIPVLIAFVLCMRLRSSEMNKRAAILRALGVSRARLQVVAATEVGLAAIAGALAGWLVYRLWWTHASRVPLTEFSFWPSDARLPRVSQALIVVAFLAVAVVVAFYAGGRTALGTRPRHEPRTPRWWWLAPWGLGAVLLGLVAVATPTPSEGKRLVVAGAVLIMCGTVVAMHLLAGKVSAVVTRRARSGAGLVAGRRLGVRDSASFRLSVAIGLALLAIGTTMPFVRSLERDPSVGEQGLASADGYLLFVMGHQVPAGRLGQLPGAKSALGFVDTEDHDGNGLRVLLANCQQLADLVRVADCSEGPHWIAIRPTVPEAFIENYRTPIHVGSTTIRRLPQSVVTAALGEEFQGALLLPASVGDDRTDGSLVSLANGGAARAHFEASLAALSPAAYYSNTYSEIIEQAHEYVPYIRLLQVSLAVGLLGLLIALIAAVLRSVKERSRDSVVLGILGATPRAKAACHVQAQATPLLLCQALALAGVAVISIALASIDADASLSRDNWVALAFVALATTALVTVLTLPAALGGSRSLAGSGHLDIWS